jgi:hypothetical protein
MKLTTLLATSVIVLASAAAQAADSELILGKSA